MSRSGTATKYATLLIDAVTHRGLDVLPDHKASPWRAAVLVWVNHVMFNAAACRRLHGNHRHTNPSAAVHGSLVVHPSRTVHVDRLPPPERSAAQHPEWSVSIRPLAGGVEGAGVSKTGAIP
jgi:hypothetical protein